MAAPVRVAHHLFGGVWDIAEAGADIEQRTAFRRGGLQRPAHLTQDGPATAKHPVGQRDVPQRAFGERGIDGRIIQNFVSAASGRRQHHLPFQLRVATAVIQQRTRVTRTAGVHFTDHDSVIARRMARAHVAFD